MIKPAINSVHKIRKPFKNKKKIHSYFEKSCNKLKNVTSKFKILKSNLESLKKFKNLPILCLNFDFISAFEFWFYLDIYFIWFFLWILDFKFDFYFLNPFRLHSINFGIPDLDTMKTSVLCNLYVCDVTKLAFFSEDFQAVSLMSL